MLSMHAFIEEYRHLIERNILESIQRNDILDIVRYYQIYRRNTKTHYLNLIKEASKVNDCISNKEVKAVDAKKWKKDIISKYSIWYKETTSFLYELGRACRDKKAYRFFLSFQFRRLGIELSKMQIIS